MGCGSAVVRIWISSRKWVERFEICHTAFSRCRCWLSVSFRTLTAKAAGAVIFSTSKGVAAESVNSNDGCVSGAAMPYERVWGCTVTGGTTSAVTGSVKVRPFGKVSVSSDAKRPLSLRGPS